MRFSNYHTVNKGFTFFVLTQYCLDDPIKVDRSGERATRMRADING